MYVLLLLATSEFDKKKWEVHKQGRRHGFKSTGSYQQNLLSQPTFDQIIKKSTASKVPFPKIYRVHGTYGPCTNAGPVKKLTIESISHPWARGHLGIDFDAHD